MTRPEKAANTVAKNALNWEKVMFDTLGFTLVANVAEWGPEKKLMIRGCVRLVVLT